MHSKLGTHAGPGQASLPASSNRRAVETQNPGPAQTFWLRIYPLTRPHVVWGTHYGLRRTQLTPVRSWIPAVLLITASLGPAYSCSVNF